MHGHADVNFPQRQGPFIKTQICYTSFKYVTPTACPHILDLPNLPSIAFRPLIIRFYNLTILF